MDGDVISAERFVPAPADAIFDLIADASRHPEIDGSGAVQEVKDGGPERLSKGSVFGMDMKMGMRYSMVNTVIEFEEGRRIAWQTRFPGFVGRFVGGRIWRYELESGDGGTRVRESWDISEDHMRPMLKLGGLPQKTKRSMEQSLQNIESLTSGS